MKLRCLAGGLLLVAGCEFNPSTVAGVEDADPNVADADPNAPDGAPLCSQWRPANFDACMLMGPLADLDLLVVGEYTYETEMGELRDPMGELVSHTNEMLSMTPPVRAMVVDSFKIAPASTLVVSGPHPLLIASFSDIDIEGRIDVGAELGSSHLPAGQEPTLCEGEVAPGAGTDAAGGSGGGGGGGFAGPGGDGGDGDGDGGSKPGGPGGQAVVSTPLSPRGGCAGARGGWVGNGVFAGGGGGASGGTGSNGSDGQLSASPASGGSGASNATSGEDGGAGSTPAGKSVTDQRGGGAGGGGGSAGFVVVWGDLTLVDSAIISPDETIIAP